MDGPLIPLPAFHEYCSFFTAPGVPHVIAGSHAP